jgi:hypothetical protein
MNSQKATTQTRDLADEKFLLLPHTRYQKKFVRHIRQSSHSSLLSTWFIFQTGSASNLHTSRKYPGVEAGRFQSTGTLSQSRKISREVVSITERVGVDSNVDKRLTECAAGVIIKVLQGFFKHTAAGVVVRALQGFVHRKVYDLQRHGPQGLS